jgi:hypothetical protein
VAQCCKTVKDDHSRKSAFLQEGQGSETIVHSAFMLKRRPRRSSKSIPTPKDYENVPVVEPRPPFRKSAKTTQHAPTSEVLEFAASEDEPDAEVAQRGLSSIEEQFAKWAGTPDFECFEAPSLEIHAIVTSFTETDSQVPPTQIGPVDFKPGEPERAQAAC